MFSAKVTGGSFPAHLSFYDRSLQGDILFVGFLFSFWRNFFFFPLKTSLKIFPSRVRADDGGVDIYFTLGQTSGMIPE
jgi:hypothetical protein